MTSKKKSQTPKLTDAERHKRFVETAKRLVCQSKQQISIAPSLRWRGLIPSAWDIAISNAPLSNRRSMNKVNVFAIPGNLQQWIALFNWPMLSRSARKFVGYNVGDL